MTEGSKKIDTAPFPPATVGEEVARSTVSPAEATAGLVGDEFVEGVALSVVRSILSGDQTTNRAARFAPKKSDHLRILRLAIQRYCEEEHISLWDPFTLKISTGTSTIEKKVNRRYVLDPLFENEFGGFSLIKIVWGLVDYFSDKDPDLAAQIIKAMNQAYGGRLGWDKRLAAFRPWTVGNLFSEHPEMVEALSAGKTVYLQSVKQWFVEPSGLWRSTISFSLSPPIQTEYLEGYIGLSLRNGELFIINFGGAGGIGLARGIQQLEPASWAPSLVLAKCESLPELAALLRKRSSLFAEIVGEIFGSIEPEKTYYLVGSSYSVIRPNGWLHGSLAVAADKPQKRNPFVTFQLREGRTIFGEAGRSNVYLLEQALKGETITPREKKKTGQTKAPSRPGPENYRPERQTRLAGAFTWSDALEMRREGVFLEEEDDDPTEPAKNSGHARLGMPWHQPLWRPVSLATRSMSVGRALRPTLR